MKPPNEAGADPGSNRAENGLTGTVRHVAAPTSMAQKGGPVTREPPPYLRDLLDGLKGIERRGEGWTARCPAHDDRDPSLSISTGDDGRILLHCHAGCSVEAICRALGVRVAKLFNGECRSTSRLNIV